MNIERMEALAKFLDELPEEKFNIGEWARNPTSRYTCPDNVNECGTVCCIAGWVAINNNLCLLPSGEIVDLLPSGEIVDVDPDDGPVGRLVSTGEFASTFAGEYLGLTSGQQHRLFYHWGWPDEFRFTETDDPNDTFYPHIPIPATPKIAAQVIWHMIGKEGV